jgi:hypothetical protein
MSAAVSPFHEDRAVRRRPGVDRRRVREEAPREDGHGHVDAFEGVVGHKMRSRLK